VTLDHPDLRDRPDVWWSEIAVEGLARTYAEKWAIDLIITFDILGVSGHANHRVLYASMSRAVRSPTFPPTFVIHSTNTLAKYSSIFGLPWTLTARAWRRRRRCHQLSNVQPDQKARYRSSLFINTPAQYLQARQAFAQHRTQRVWFRDLYLLFSRYLWFVELTEIGGGNGG